MADINLLLGLGTVKRFDKKQIVFIENDAGSCMYIVLKGVFGVYLNSFTDFPVQVAAVEKGSFFGEMSLIDEWPRSASVISEEEGAALEIEKDKLQLLFEKAPDIISSMLTTMQSRADAAAKALRGAGKPAPEAPQTKDGNYSSIMETLYALSGYIRNMNNLLLSGPGAPEPDSARVTGAGDLLPHGYEPFNCTDDNDNSDMLMKRSVICPYCDMKSEAYIPNLSALIQDSVTLDGRVIYKDFNILLYMNIICPNCNYADSYQEFSKYRRPAEVPAYKGNQFKNAENFTGFTNTHRHTLDEAVACYYLQLKCLKAKTNEPLRFAKVWMRLYWLYREHGRDELAKQAAEKAVVHYADYIGKSNGAMRVYDEMRVNAMLGELVYYLGHSADAKKYFERSVLLGRQVKDPASQELAEQCRERYRKMKTNL